MANDFMALIENAQDANTERVNNETQYIINGFQLFGASFMVRDKVVKSFENLRYLFDHAPEFQAPNLYTDDATGTTYLNGEDIKKSGEINCAIIAEHYAYPATISDAKQLVQMANGANLTNVWEPKIAKIGEKWDRVERLKGFGATYYQTTETTYNSLVFKFWLNGVVHNLTKKPGAGPFPFSLDIISEAQGIGKSMFFHGINKALTGQGFQDNLSFDDNPFNMSRIIANPLAIDDEFKATLALNKGRNSDPNASIKQFITRENVFAEFKGRDGFNVERRYTVGRTTNNKTVYSDISTGFERRFLPVQPGLRDGNILVPISTDTEFYTQLIAEAYCTFNDYSGYGLTDKEVEQLCNFILPDSIKTAVKREQSENKYIDLATETITEVLESLTFDNNIFDECADDNEATKRLESAFTTSYKDGAWKLTDFPNIRTTVLSRFLVAKYNDIGTARYVSRAINKILSGYGFEGGKKHLVYTPDKNGKRLYKDVAWNEDNTKNFPGTYNND